MNTRIIKFTTSNKFQYMLSLLDFNAKDRHLTYRFERIMPSPEILFEGNNYVPGMHWHPCSPMSVYTLMGYLMITPGGTDKNYFENYTPSQIAFRDNEAKELSYLVDDSFGNNPSFRDVMKNGVHYKARSFESMSKPKIYVTVTDGIANVYSHTDLDVVIIQLDVQNDEEPIEVFDKNSVNPRYMVKDISDWLLNVDPPELVTGMLEELGVTQEDLNSPA